MTSRYFRLTRFGRLVIILTIALTLITMIPIAVGRASTETDALQALGFWTCDGKPCFMGITPYITTWNEAIAVTDGRENTKSQDEDSIIVRLNVTAFVDIGIRRHSGSDKVSEASLLLWEEQQPYFPKLGDFVRMYGPPRCVRVIMIESMIERVVLLFPGLSLTISPDGNRVSPTSSIWGVRLKQDEGTTTSCRSAQDDSSIRTSQWSGFVSIDRYVP
jgi:hypothetical protein